MATITDRYVLEIDVEQGRRGLGDVTRGADGLGRSLGSIRGIAAAAGGALAALGAVNLAGSAVEQYQAYERLNVQLQTYLGSQEAANAEMERLKQLANDLPQDLQDIASAFTILTRTGIDTSNETITALSNVATANAKSFDQLGEAVADALTGEFERLKEFGVKVSKEGEQFVVDMGNNNKVIVDSAQGVVEALIGMGSEGGRFAGAAAANANTLSQTFSNMQGAVFEASIAFSEGLKPGLQEAVLLFTDLIRNNEGLIQSLGEGLGTAISWAVEGIQNLITYFTSAGENGSIAGQIFNDILVPAFNNFKAILDALSPVLGLIGEIFSNILVPVFSAFMEILGVIIEAISPFIEILVTLLETALKPVGDILGVIIGLFTNVIEVIGSIIEWVGNLVSAFVSGFADIASAIYDGVTAPITYVKDSFAGLWDYLWGNSVAEDIVNTTIDGFKDMGDGMIEGVEGVDQTIGGIFNNIYNTVVSGLGSAVQSAVDGVRNAFSSVTGWLGGLFGSTEDSANSAGDAINNAVTQNLDTVQLDKANESLARMNEIVAAQSEVISAHAQVLRDSQDAFTGYNDVQGSINESLTAISSTRESLNDLQTAELEYYKGVNGELETYVEYLNTETEQFTNKIDLYEQMIDHYATITESINNLNTAYGDAQSNVQTAIEKDGEFNTSLGELSTTLTDVVSTAFSAHIEGLNNTIAKTAETTSATDQLVQSMNNLASASQAAQSAATSAMSSINNAINSAKQLESIQQGTSGGFGFRNPFAGFFANGGTIPAGQFGIAGEAGPEIVSGPATVTPLDSVGSNSNVTYNINAVDAQSFKALLARDPEYLHAVVQRGSKRFTGRR